MLLDIEEGYLECPEHGLYPDDYFTCPGCDVVERDIDEAIEREHERKDNHG